MQKHVKNFFGQSCTYSRNYDTHDQTCLQYLLKEYSTDGQTDAGNDNTPTVLGSGVKIHLSFYSMVYFSKIPTKDTTSRSPLYYTHYTYCNTVIKQIIFQTSQELCNQLVYLVLVGSSSHSDNPLRSLQWRHNGHDSVSDRQPHNCLINRLFRRRSKKTSKLRVTGLCAGNSPGPMNSLHTWPVMRKMFPFDDVIM